LAQRLGVSEQMIRRRSRNLADCGLLKAMPRNPGQGRGRPEWIYSLTSEGVRLLAKQKILPEGVPHEQVTATGLERMIEHQLMLNSLAVKFAHIGEKGGQSAVHFISSTSPFHSSNTGGTLLLDKVEFPDGRTETLKPDAAVCITHKGLGKSLLFFVEIDMGTEVVADPKHLSRADVRRKIIMYRNYLGRCGYRRYGGENLFNARFNGFRVLLLAATAKRYEALCRLARTMPPSDFIWLTHQSALENEGCGGSIWAAGGREGLPFSILRRAQVEDSAPR